MSMNVDFEAVTVIIPSSGEVSRLNNLVTQVGLAASAGLKIIVGFHETHEIAVRQEIYRLPISILSNIKFVSGSFINQGAIRNACLKLISTEWVCFLDDDDQMHFANVLKMARVGQERGVGFVIGRLQVLDQHGTTKITHSSWNFQQSLLVNLGLFPGFTRCLYRSSIAKEIYFGDYPMGEDLYFLLAYVSLEPSFAYIDEVVYFYNIGSADQATTKKALFSQVDRALWANRKFLHQIPDLVIAFSLSQYWSLLKNFQFRNLKTIALSTLILVHFFLTCPRSFLRAISLKFAKIPPL
jgi:glycosyltransferase involved in cell wall biosynthesis